MSESVTATVPSAEDRVVIDLGTRPSKQVKLLRRGQGRLLDEVDDCIAELRSAGVITAAQVVVVTVQEQAVRRPAAPMMLLPGFPPFVVPGLSCP